MLIFLDMDFIWIVPKRLLGNLTIHHWEYLPFGTKWKRVIHDAWHIRSVCPSFLIPRPSVWESLHHPRTSSSFAKIPNKWALDWNKMRRALNSFRNNWGNVQKTQGELRLTRLAYAQLAESGNEKALNFTSRSVRLLSLSFPICLNEKLTFAWISQIQ